jgi:hypothetical protein
MPHTQRGTIIDTQGDWTSTARRMWLGPVAILVSFRIGGFIADLIVDGVDSVGAALAGGLIAGAIIGAAEWFALRRWISWPWILATSAGVAAGLVAGAALVDYGIARGDLALMECRDRRRCRGLAGAGARTTWDPPCVLVGHCELACLGPWLARDFVRDHEKRR